MDRKWKMFVVSLILMLLLLIMPACSDAGGEEEPDNLTEGEIQTELQAEPDDADDSEDEEVTEMKMTINDTAVTVEWENNSSARALADMAKNGPVTIQMSAYGGFEQVGSIGTTLPSSDTNIKTKAGDIMLYTSDHMVIFYGSNSWAYTRLGRITDKSKSELQELLGGSGVTVTVTAD